MKKILTSLFVIGITVAATVGATRAYFTDNATSTDNVLGTGTFNVKLAGQNDSGTQYSNMEDRKFFNVSGLMPGGDPAVAYIEVKNDSTEDMLFRLYAQNVDEDEEGLRNYLRFKATLRPSGYPPVLGGDLYGSTDNVLFADTTVGSIVNSWNALDNVSAACGDAGWSLKPGMVAVYKVEVWLDWSADDAYQDAELTADLQLDATQFNDDMCSWDDGERVYTAW